MNTGSSGTVCYCTYYAAISYIDNQVGKILDVLEEEGLSENTIIVVWGDHGWHLGDFRVWGKHTLFDRSLNSVLMIKDPRKSGNVVNQVVSTVDIYPTLMELAGLEKDSLDGASMVGLMDGASDNWENRAFSYFKNGISLRTPEFRLTRYYNRDSQQVELFDHRYNDNESANISTQSPDLVDSLLPYLEKGNTGLYLNNR